MKKESEKNKGKLGAVDNGELSPEEYSTAEYLASLKYVKLDETSAFNLIKLKRKFLRPIIEEEEEAEPSSSSTHGIRIENIHVAADLPPIPAISSVIGRCSMPCEKQLKFTDLSDHQTRLSLIKNQVKTSILPLLEEGEDVIEGFHVTTYDWEGNEYDMRFVFWADRMYVLTSRGWKMFYKQHQLMVHDILRVWMFRHRLTNKLCFAIIRL